MTDEDDTRQPARLPLLESGLSFRERGRLGKLPEQASGPEWAAMLKGTGYGSGAWWGHKITRAIRQRDLKASTRGIIKRTEILRWLAQYDAVPEGWRELTLPVPAVSASIGCPIPKKPAPTSKVTALDELAAYLPLREQARLGCLPDALHVEQIATLEYPDNQALALAYANVLLNACSNNGLPSTKAQYQDWWIEDGATDEVSEEFQWWYKNLFEYVSEKGSTPLVTRTAYRDWLVQQGRPLPAWWFPEMTKPVSTEEIRFRIENKLSIRNPCSVHYWTTIEWWTLEQTSFIFNGQEPIDDDDIPHGAPLPWKNAHPASKRLYESLRAAVEVGTISAIPITRNGRDSHRVKSIDAYRWLRQVYKETVHVPTELVEFFEAALLAESEQAKPEKPTPSASNLTQVCPVSVARNKQRSPTQGATVSRKRRIDALAEAIDAALEVLSPDGRLPTAAVLFEYLRTQDKTGVVIPGNSPTVFYWYANNGNKQSADISVITKRLGRIKKGN
jgi:hypothetical protein